MIGLMIVGLDTRECPMVKIVKMGLDLAVDLFQCKRDLKWIRFNVKASKYGNGSKLDL